MCFMAHGTTYIKDAVSDSRWCHVVICWSAVFVACRLQKQLDKHNIVLASYDVVRNDIDFFS